MSNFKLEFKLIQHTPIIHFQSYQDGATLRGTELKPKLDKFLIKYIFRDNFDDYKEFLKDFSTKTESRDIKLAFNYKVAIKSSNIKFYDIDLKNKNSKINSFPCFFAMMGDEWQNNKKRFSIEGNFLTVEIKSFNTKLLKIIEKNFALFLAITNFGTRQSKGFGSFYLADRNDIEEAIMNVKNECWSFPITINNRTQRDNLINWNQTYEDYYQLFEKIDLLYKTLRSGMNLKNTNGETVFYFKSLLYEYVKVKHSSWIWDKKAIKSKFLDDTDLKDKVLVRDLLGLSTVQEYKSDGFSVRHPKDKDNNTKYPLNEVERFKSPIIFKPIKISQNEFRVYIFIEGYEEAIFKKNFLILKDDSSIRDSLNIKTPTSFDLKEFLTFAFEFNIEKHIQNYTRDGEDYTNHFNYNHIKELYSNLKECR